MDDEKTLKQIIREELSKLAKLSWGQRFVYIWDYYKPLMVALIVIAMLISMGVTIYHNLQLNYLLNAYLINCNALEVDADAMTAEFTEMIGGIGKNDVVTIDTSMDLRDTTSQYGVATQMKMTALVSAASMDLLIVDREAYERYMDAEYFADLSSVFTPEQLEQWSDLLVTADGTKVSECTDSDVVPYGIDLMSSPKLNQYNAYMGNEVFGVVAVNAAHTDLCDDFFSYLLQE